LDNDDFTATKKPRNDCAAWGNLKEKNKKAADCRASTAQGNSLKNEVQGKVDVPQQFESAANPPPASVMLMSSELLNIECASCF
jgi:hypothetical protein